MKNLSSTTSKMASISLKNRNANRDLFRYIRCPVDIVYVSCPVFADPGGDKVVEQLLPMVDPHELLEWMASSGRIKVPPTTIQPLATIFTVRNGLDNF